ncbi:response regulator transcription factor [Candidatus Chloroploca sp. M-50]|uniref:Response regulator transcription factor n=1 Tax=Candidatus Chloroploca mongolica TaxID=2528176 RepID=A0ABS4D8X3_9CHLR|nr:response regulator transcription factor [Candidatus Chloroploca mongolica]MBP1465864.1 response regulator transcription factor [Candidatus Chloroploca mongolica]
MITVFIIAPTPALRAGLRAMAASDTIEIIGEAAGAVLAPAADVILVAGDNVAAIGRALAGNEGVALVALSDDQRLPGLLRSLALSGWAVALPEAGAEEVQAAIYAAAHGYVALPQRFAEQLPGTRLTDEPPAEPLTPRETEVLSLLSQGLPNKQIALRLQISEHTVKFHIGSIFTKLGATSRTEAVSIGARQGLLTL